MRTQRGIATVRAQRNGWGKAGVRTHVQLAGHEHKVGVDARFLEPAKKKEKKKKKRKRSNIGGASIVSGDIDRTIRPSKPQHQAVHVWGWARAHVRES